MTEYEMYQDKIFLEELYKEIQECRRFRILLKSWQPKMMPAKAYFKIKDDNEALIEQMKRDHRDYISSTKRIIELENNEELCSEIIEENISYCRILKSQIRDKYKGKFEFPEAEMPKNLNLSLNID